MSPLAVLAFTQGDPAGIGPEVVLRALERLPSSARACVVAEAVALESVRHLVPRALWRRLEVVHEAPSREAIASSSGIVVWDPVGERRELTLGHSTAPDARGALAALDAGLDLARRGVVDALLTAPVSKASIAQHCLPGFVGHTDYLAAACGCERYGRDYLMAFLAPRLRVALLTVHSPLAAAIAAIDEATIVDALTCLARHARGPIAVAGLDPHAGEGGLLGEIDAAVVAPAVARARSLGVDAHGPESADSLFARARRGEFAWVLALYHDQGLIAVKTAAFGLATNWTLGLPILRTSVDHGTAFALAGSGRAEARPMRTVIATTLRLLGDAEEGTRWRPPAERR